MKNKENDKTTDKKFEALVNCYLKDKDKKIKEAKDLKTVLNIFASLAGRRVS